MAMRDLMAPAASAEGWLAVNVALYRHVSLSQLSIDNRLNPPDCQKLQLGGRLSAPNLIFNHTTPNPNVFVFRSALDIKLDPPMPHLGQTGIFTPQENVSGQ